ncbi:MAG: IS1096 element passenger TnpR family protein, partial [Bacillota bacterium]
ELFKAFLQVGPGNSITGKDYRTISSLRCLFRFDHRVILQLATFDICSYELNEEASSPYDGRLKSITPTPFGIEICSLLLQQGFRYRPQELYPLPYRPLAARLGMYKPKKGLHKVLAKAFPAGAIAKTVEDEPVMKQPGAYYFKVALRKTLWRTIKLAHTHSLYDLHLAIEDAFEFDEEHLYAFYLDIGELERRRGRYGIYCSEFEDEVFNVEDAVIGICGFYPGQSMIYLFDFGGRILFDITLLKIDTDEPLPHSPVVVEQKGELPELAPDWDYL